MRIGLGYDIHRTGEGDHVWLGGVLIAAPFSLIGHSDADVLLHAITDAILGAIADYDIGHHFRHRTRVTGAARAQTSCVLRSNVCRTRVMR